MVSGLVQGPPVAPPCAHSLYGGGFSSSTVGGGGQEKNCYAFSTDLHLQTSHTRQNQTAMTYKLHTQSEPSVRMGSQQFPVSRVNKDGMCITFRHLAEALIEDSYKSACTSTSFKQRIEVVMANQCHKR